MNISNAQQTQRQLQNVQQSTRPLHSYAKTKHTANHLLITLVSNKKNVQLTNQALRSHETNNV